MLLKRKRGCNLGIKHQLKVMRKAWHKKYQLAEVRTMQRPGWANKAEQQRITINL